MSRYDDLACFLLDTLTSAVEHGAGPAHLRAAIVDILEQELPDPTLLERLAQVYTVDTDQVALIALVDEARLAVSDGGAR